MDFDNFFVLLIIFSFVARLIGEAVKGPKKGGPQQGRKPGQLPRDRPRLPGERPRPGPSPDEASAPRRQAPPERASEMIPEELWQILTGQSRPPAPAPAPLPEPAEADDEEEAFELVGERMPAERRRDESELDKLLRERLEVADRNARAPEVSRPRVVSMETEPQPSRLRHAAFHAKYEAQAAATVDRGRAAPTLANIAGEGPNALRRAIILQEILGRPRGLE